MKPHSLMSKLRFQNFKKISKSCKICPETDIPNFEICLSYRENPNQLTIWGLTEVPTLEIEHPS